MSEIDVYEEITALHASLCLIAIPDAVPAENLESRCSEAVEAEIEDA